MGRKLITASDIAYRAVAFMALNALAIAAINSLDGPRLSFGSVASCGIGVVVGMLLARNLIDEYTEIQKRIAAALKETEEAKKGGS